MARRPYDDRGRDFACAFLPKLGIKLGQDFHALSSDQVERLTNAAKVLRYRKPRNANGSTARYLYALLTRQCGR